MNLIIKALQEERLQAPGMYSIPLNLISANAIRIFVKIDITFSDYVRIASIKSE